MGCDFDFAIEEIEIKVSIHAPAWGATRRREMKYRIRPSFNPRTRMGCDANVYANNPAMEFQSTHPHGVRPTVITLSVFFIACFNPRTRMGCDGRHHRHSPHGRGFNPRTRMGCDLCHRGCIRHTPVSIHAPAWGATKIVSYSRDKKGFQSTHPHGVRQIGEMVEAHRAGFQSTHPHGVRPGLCGEQGRG